MSDRELPPERRPKVGRVTVTVVILAVLLVCSRWIAGYAIEIEWWKELGQIRTWWSMLYYGIAPVALATLAAFIVLWISHARALKFARTGLGQHPLYARVSTVLLALLAWLIAAGAIDSWTVVRFAGSRGLPAAATAWHDTVFAKPLAFYLFDLPFYSLLRGYLLAVVIVCILVYWIAARGWQLRYRFPDIQKTGEIDP